jgi:dihydropyrimidinase
VKSVLLRGQLAIDKDKCLISKGFGRFIKRKKVSNKI